MSNVRTDLKKRYRGLIDNGQQDKLFSDFLYGWRNNGVFRDGTEFSIEDAVHLTVAAKKGEFSDALTMNDMPMWIPRTMNTIIREAIEPVLVGERLLTRIGFKPGQIISLGTMGAIAGDFEVSESGEFQEVKVQWADGSTIRTTGRSGLSLRFAPDIIRYSAFPVIELHTKKAARALARFKEEKIFATISELGQIIFDNDTPANAVIGCTTGRGFTGAANGSLTAEDWMDLFGQVCRNGFMPNAALVHPMAYMAFMKDPYMKYMAANGNGNTWWGSYTGNPVANYGWANMDGRGMGNGQFSVPANSPTGASATADWQFPPTDTAPVFPSYFWGNPVTVIVSPFVPFDPDTNRTDIIVFDSRELGYLVVDQDLQMKDFTNPESDIYTIKMDERYSIQIANEGQGVAVAKSVSINPGNLMPTMISPTISVDGSLEEIDRTVSPYSSGS